MAAQPGNAAPAQKDPEIKCIGIHVRDPLSLIVFVAAGGFFLFADYSLKGETTFMLNVLFLFAWTSDLTPLSWMWIEENFEDWRLTFAPFAKVVTPSLPSQVLGICAVFGTDSGNIFLVAGWVWAFLMHFLVNFKYKGNLVFFQSWYGAVAMFVDFMMGLCTHVWMVEGIGGVLGLDETANPLFPSDDEQLFNHSLVPQNVTGLH
mmetsp:Transcript_57567/g.126074  ORF Transcript_57567/g.126074 Transcript_57567/m.126074 type:complete len:205 (+) Transcript_57567:37-651(+)|eukprot:CAMPEP_0204266092 /NCGR_PEP_ID=MMETSP0468-20130131/10110_1 /ASSEMBLY_ACC=CAM_ASM_000383 /TAXON_ID=2969 /ORGANISM="Oxyrrhis marina" /LENGTH=204 /DNA_ID=CAMNT_0051241117 /DNA_START=37 /DNA_END=651 /DNA_ORIENTATION=-